jgi:ABC-type glycerol-3-phosphate transport system substrate-binding protein
MVLAQVNLMVESWQLVVISSGGQFINIDTGTLNLDSGPVVDATARIANWYKEGIMPPDSLQYQDNELITAFQQGRVAMGIVSLGWFRRMADPTGSEFADQFKVAARVPSGPEGSGQTLLSSWSLGINKASKHKEEALQFIEFATSDEIQLWLATEHNNEPVTSATFEDPAYLAVNSQAPAILSAVSDGRPNVEKLRGYSDVTFSLQATLSSIWAGDVSAADGLAKANKEYQSLVSP